MRMISHKHDFIFVHIPKTGGNSIQTILAPFSDDRIEARHSHQDGSERFAVRGRLTPDKHVGLDYYARFVNLDRFRIVTCVRHPVERLLSFYFSPSHWYARRRDGSWHLQDAYWDRARFLASLAPRAVDFLRVDGTFRAADDLLHFDRLAEDFAGFLRDAKLPATASLPKLNATRVTSGPLEEAKADPIVTEIARTRYREDFERFGFELP